MQQKKFGPYKRSILGGLKPLFKRTFIYGMAAMVLSAGGFVCFIKGRFHPICAIFSVRQCMAEEPVSVSVHRNESFRETTYRAVKGDCSIEWIARDVEPGVIKLRSLCDTPLAEQLPLIERVYGEFLQKDANALEFHTLFWGRIEPDRPDGSREMSFRLALAAHKSPGWDIRRGKPENGNINGFVTDLANREMIYPELKNLFDRFNRDFRFSSAERFWCKRQATYPSLTNWNSTASKPKTNSPMIA